MALGLLISATVIVLYRIMYSYMSPLRKPTLDHPNSILDRKGVDYLFDETIHTKGSLKQESLPPTRDNLLTYL